jgi:dipeptidyl aminopeptidase/acylaminoacyl peptidase
MNDRASTPAARTKLLGLTAFLLLLAVLIALPPTFTSGADGDKQITYRTPPSPLAAIVDAPPTPATRLSPDRQWMLLMEYPNLVGIDELAEPELRLAGLRIRPRTNGPSRGFSMTRLTLKSVADLSERPITGLPEGARIGNVMWSPDGSHLAVTVTEDADIRLWTVDVATARARRLGDYRLNAAGGTPVRWLSDSRTLIVSAVPDRRGDAPESARVPRGPIVRENSGEAKPARTYQDLLKNAHDEELFDYYLTAQLHRVDLDGNAKPLGRPGILWDFAPSPDGRYLHVEMLHRPFSYLVPAWRFPNRIEIWNMEGEVVHRVADLPLQESVPVPFGSVPTGPRSIAWRADTPATLYWAEAQDGGDAGREADVRDKVFMLAAPFDGPPRVLATLGLRYSGVDWANETLAIASEWWWKTRKVRAWRLDPSNPDAEPDLLVDRSWEDRYNDPGDPVTVPNAWGRSVLFTPDGGTSLFLAGDGASPEGDRPFLDRFDLKTKESERLWRSEAPYYERALFPVDPKGKRFLTRRESKDEPPNYFVRDLGGGELRRLTDFPHPTPQLEGLQKELIRYERDDGVALTATLYLPPGYTQDQGPLPVLVWAYPQEFKSADHAGQVTDSPHRFDRVGWWSPLLFLTVGYAVLDDPTMPIIGEGEVEPNDTYVEQLVTSAKAAIDEVARRGVGDPDRVAIGGHSYGAFMTANLLAHSDLFRAGIARSGAYNRTLTPFGFQAEERTLWQASEIYFRMSPFMHADKVDEPILLIHGEADNNSGTFPMQSERFYNALKGLGANARLVMLPHESHGYRARESVMHMLWESASWLDHWVKDAPFRAAGGTETGGAADPD